jgi:GntR family histidine utilization transcriptional repressor
MSQSTARAQPLYEKVKNHILTRINRGVWRESARVPSENELVKEFSISRMTANRALRELTSEGYLVRVRGVGTFVAAKKAQSHLLEIRNIAEEVRIRGHNYSGTVISNRIEKIGAPLAEKMDLETGDSVFHSVMVHKEENIPIQLENRYVNRKVAPGYGKVDFNKTTPSAYLLKVAPLQEVEHIVQAVMPDKRTAALLELRTPDEPCLLVRRRTWSKGMVASYAELFHAGSRYELSGRFRP